MNYYLNYNSSIASYDSSICYTNIEFNELAFYPWEHDVSDYSGNGNDLNWIQTTAQEPVGWINGKVGEAAEISLSIAIGDSSLVYGIRTDFNSTINNLIEGVSTYSISTWVYNMSNVILIGLSFPYPNIPSYLDNPLTMRTWVDDVGFTDFYFEAYKDEQSSIIRWPIPTSYGVWHHYVFINGDNPKLYRDSLLIVDSSVTGSSWSSVSGPDVSTLGFHGSVDQTRIFNRSLNQTEINLLYNAGRGI